MLITLLLVLVVINEARRRRKSCNWDTRAASTKIWLGVVIAIGSEVLMRIGPAQLWSIVWIVGMVLQLTAIYAIARGVYRKLDLRQRPVLLASHQTRPLTPAAYQQPNWGDSPGCFERHLQRRFNNLFFPPERRIVSDEDIRVARVQDQADAAAFKMEAQQVLDEISKLPETGTVHECLEWRQRLDDMVDRAAAIGGTVTNEAAALLSVRNSLMQTVHDCAMRDNPAAVQGLQKAERAQRKAAAIARNPFLAQMQRKDTPITAADVIPSLLCESPEAIRFALEVMGEQTDVSAARRTAAQTLLSAKAEGFNDPLFEEKLAAVGASVAVGRN